MDFMPQVRTRTRVAELAGFISAGMFFTLVIVWVLGEYSNFLRQHFVSVTGILGGALMFGRIINWNLSGNGNVAQGFFRGLESFGRIVANCINVFLLSLVYVLGIGMIACVAKVARRKFLRSQQKEGSYFIPRVIRMREKGQYYKPF